MHNLRSFDLIPAHPNYALSIVNCALLHVGRDHLADGGRDEIRE